MLGEQRDMERNQALDGLDGKARTTGNDWDKRFCCRYWNVSSSTSTREPSKDREPRSGVPHQQVDSRLR